MQIALGTYALYLECRAGLKESLLHTGDGIVRPSREFLGDLAVIEQVRITGYRKFRELTFTPHPRRNIIVGDNEAGKSTLLEAIGLALTGRANGRVASEELTPFWFNQDVVREFFAAREKGETPAPPEISIEVFLTDRDDLARLVGANNSRLPVEACPGVVFRVGLNLEYAEEFEAYLSGNNTAILPVEYFRTEWRSFADMPLTQRPKALSTAIIDSRTVRSSSGVDYHLRQILSDHLEVVERAAISVAYRRVKEQMTDQHLAGVNSKLAALGSALGDDAISLAMDQSSRTAWDTSVVPHVNEVPFGMAGLGQQAAIKITLAMGKEANGAGIVMVEEPENHLSHASLNVLLDRIARVANDDQQLFITTHSSYVLNRLGLDGLQLISDATVHPFGALSPDTVDYYKKLPGYDTLRVVLAPKLVLVEGPSDELVFERLYRDARGTRPIAHGIDVLSMRGLSTARFLELAKLLRKPCAVLSDNDGKSADELAEIRTNLAGLLSDDRCLFFGHPEAGRTLEPQLIAANDLAKLKEILGLRNHADLLTWMTNNKTEGALRLLQSQESVVAPQYFLDAIEFISA